ncbi:MAG: glycosyltransferase [Pirellulaceae bacterium]
MRVGIWCDYGFTLEPSEGIGVFVANLAKGIIEASADAEILLVPHPNKSKVLNPIVDQGNGRIKVAQRLSSSWIQRKAARRICKSFDRMAHWIAKAHLPESTLLRSLQVALASPAAAAEIVELEKRCDVWLVPYVGTDQKFNNPTVVAVHDLVAFHFPATVRPHQLQSLKRMVSTQVKQADRLACMSEFIRQNDLLDILQAKPSETAVVRPAVPNFGPVTESEATDLSSLGIEQPFIFYPAAFRTYKNHRLLVETLGHLRKNKELWPMQMVFTGIRSCPRWLRAYIKECRAETEVVCLGKVSAEMLSRLYRSAFATVVPSLYEQGSFPIMEAIHYGCPAVCSDIPSLREQFGDMGAAMLFFDPHSPKNLVEQLAHVGENRRHVIRGQQAAFAKFATRTWSDAAQEWLEVFEQAMGSRNTVPAKAA